MKSSDTNITEKSFIHHIKATASKIVGNLFAMLITLPVVLLSVIGVVFSECYFHHIAPTPPHSPLFTGGLTSSELGKEIAKIASKTKIC